MKVWQPGSHLSEQRGGEVRDWSWRRTRRRFGLLVRLSLPYRGRTLVALGTLLAYTLVALAPPYLAKLAIDLCVPQDRTGARHIERMAVTQLRFDPQGWDWYQRYVAEVSAAKQKPAPAPGDGGA